MRSMGISGIGGKIATLVLGMDDMNKHSDIDIFTYDGQSYTIVNVPWSYIIQNKIYTNQISHMYMNEVERQEYDELIDGTGTIIRFKHTPIFNSLLLSQFKYPSLLPLPQRIGFIFGNLEASIFMKEEEELYDLELFNYFGDNTECYHHGKSQHTIEFYKDTDKGHFRYVLDLEGTSYEFKREEKNVKTTLSVVSPEDKFKWELLNSFIITTGMKKNTNVVNNETLTESWGQTTIIRNGQVINTVNIEGLKPSMAKTSSDMWFKIKGIRSQIAYYTVSCQENDIDLVMGIGENKNQHNGNIPKELNRMIRYLRELKFNSMYEDPIIKPVDSISKQECKRLFEEYMNTFEGDTIKQTKPIQDMLKMIRKSRK